MGVKEYKVEKRRRSEVLRVNVHYVAVHANQGESAVNTSNNVHVV